VPRSTNLAELTRCHSRIAFAIYKEHRRCNKLSPASNQLIEGAINFPLASNQLIEGEINLPLASNQLIDEV